MRVDETVHAGDLREWLEPDGRGGFASGTVSGIRTRRYHALLLPATTPPTGRVVLVSGLDVWVDGPWGSVALSSQRYAPDVVYPDGASRLSGFTTDPWPTWTFTLPDGSRLVHELVVDRESGSTALRWTAGTRDGALVLRVRPFIAAREYHSLQHQNAAFRFDVQQRGSLSLVRPYEGVPPLIVSSSGTLVVSPDWYRQFVYAAEVERGLDAVEDLATVGEWVFPLDGSGAAVMLLGCGGPDGEPDGEDAGKDSRTDAGIAAGIDTAIAAGMNARTDPSTDAVRAVTACFDREAARRAALGSRLARAADGYLVTRGAGTTVIAGYPWFTDWGRDTFIAIRGLCLATGRMHDARSILLQWATTVSAGMVPNRFADAGGTIEFNSVDASLWFVVAVGEFLDAASAWPGLLDAEQRRQLCEASLAVVSGYHAGTRFGIRADADGLLRAGEAGQQLTWMDARVGDREITPRIGKPVEVQALWINALALAVRLDGRWGAALRTARRAFADRFWADSRGYLADVVDVDHQPGLLDETLRPNQILAVGGLPVAALSGEAARQVVDVVERTLVTPLGLRSLAPADRRYVGRYEGGPADRDAVYHQGTVWPWLLGPFVDAWLRVRGNEPAARAEARRRFVEPLLAHLDEAGLDHVSEIADGDAPWTPRGCPFQAWSLGELIRIDRLTREERSGPGNARRRRAPRRVPRASVV